MKTPTLESIEKKYRNAKKVRCLATDTIFELDFNSIHNDPLFKHTLFWANSKEKNYNYTLATINEYAEIISYIEPTTEVRNSVLLQLADNNSYSEEILKKECPKLFENEKDKLIKEALKRGFKKGVVVKNHQGIFVLDELDIVFSEKYNYGIWTKQGIGIWLFINDVWASIIETPTDIITIVEKYGKDKVISLIEKM